MGTGQIHKEVFVKHCQDQLKIINKLAEDNYELDFRLIEVALERLIESEYEK